MLQHGRATGLTLYLLSSLFFPLELRPQEAKRDLGSVVFFHPDGMGVNHWGAVRMAEVGPDGRLNWDELPHMAVYIGHMKDRLTSTSHGGATVHAYGVKVVADSYGMDGDEPVTARSGRRMSLLQEAGAAGLATGMVNSGTITEPGTGVFAASVTERANHTEIARQILESGAEVILGGGERFFLPDGAPGVYGEGVRTDGRDLITEARGRGYTIVRTRRELLSLPDTVSRLLGLFAGYHTFDARTEKVLLEADSPPYAESAPTIAEMTGAALDVLSRTGRRFFLVVEEEGTDNFANANNASGTLEAGRRADRVIGVLRQYIRDHPNTLMVMTSDSDAGGMQVLGGQFEGPSAPEREGNGSPLDGIGGAGGELFLAAPDASGRRLPFAVAWAAYADVSGGILVRADGLHSDRVAGTMDNTDVYRVLYRVLLGPLPE
jgi:alkaline phosphatase